MKRMMIIFMVVIGFCFVLVAQDNGMDEFWKKHPELLKEYYTDVYLPKLKMSKDNVSTFKDEYFNKVENIVIEDYKKQNRQNEISKDFNYNNFISKYLIEEKMVKYRFNLLKFNELKEMGINYFDIVFNGVNYRDLYNKTTIADYYFNNCIIFSGTIIDSTYIFKLDTVSIFGVDKEIKEHYANYRIRIDEIIKGDYLIDNLPENISLFNNYGAKTYVRDDRPYRMFDKTILIEKDVIDNNTKFFENEKVIIFIPYNEPAWAVDKFIQGKLNLSTTTIIYEQLLNLPDWVKNEEVYKYERNMYSYQSRLEENKDQKIVINKIIDFLKELEVINDTPNFYNRSNK